jgi:divalent metal cation (Fe/Co/Zn/Cd) transporter
MRQTPPVTSTVPDVQRIDVTRNLIGGRTRVFGDMYRKALFISAVSTVWSSVASVAAIAIGMAEASLTLAAFGVVQLFDFVSGVALVAHFRGGTAAERLERAVVRLVAAGLLVLGCMTALFSFVHLYQGHAPSASHASMVLALASCVVLAALALRKHHLARRLQHRALRADGNLSGIGATLAGVTVAGTSTASVFDLWWADPAAALVIGLAAIGVGASTRA